MPELIARAYEHGNAASYLLVKGREDYEAENVSKATTTERHHIRPDMTVLEVVSRYRQTESVFSKYDEQAGECISCQALFDTLEHVAARYGLNLEGLLADIEAVADKV